MKVTPLIERFTSKYTKLANGCWEWHASKNLKGYGQIYVNRKPRTASRVAYELFKSLIPDGLWVLHSCDNPACVNPEHLFLGTVVDNNRDMYTKGRNGQSGMQGEAHHQAKLKETDVLVIREDPRSRKVIALEYGVTTALVGMIKRKAIWKHI